MNLDDNSWKCGKDDGRCPGAFHVGCQEDSEPTEDPTGPTEDPTEPSPEPSPTTPAWEECLPSNNNTLGECCCQDQIFMSEDCRQGFYCTAQHPGYQGCAIQAILILQPCCVKKPAN